MNYRERIYTSYVSSGQARNVDGLSKTTIFQNKPYVEKLINSFFYKRTDSIIYDLGCGYGKYLFFLKQKSFLNIKGVDVSKEQVDIAHKLGLHEVECGEIDDFLKRQTTEADFILLMDILEHLTKDELFNMLDLVYHKVKNGGKIIIHIPNGEGIFGSRIAYGDLSHEVCFTPSSINQLLKIIGFKKINVYEDKPIIHGPLSFLRRVIWMVGTLPTRILMAAETGSTSAILSQNMTVVAEK
ncbi:MAG TPA: methyltransferase domain-containing protein [Segetibacter sp.]|jgi:2-polyprenyl-3-methyl-5-hydroxy-6-metoxy-1,4-benzoquinol methylase